MAWLCNILFTAGISLSIAAPLVWHSDASQESSNRTFVNRLFQIISEAQVTGDVPFKTFVHWRKEKGVYSSGVRLNFHGKLNVAEVRHLLEVFDNNMFVTAWISAALLEAHVFSNTPRPSDEQLEMALNAIAKHQDKNKAYNTSIMTFWPQTFNATAQYWECTPVNLLEFFKLSDHVPVNALEEFLRMVGLAHLADDLDLLFKHMSTMKQAFYIPPDFDDTFVNLGLGSLLYNLRSELPRAWKVWSSQNTNISSVFQALKKYAYRPFIEDPDVNSIDPRSYFYLREFLDLAYAERKDVALVTTWAQNIPDMRSEFYRGVAMPFWINNIDITVAANVVYGVTSSVLSGLVSASVFDDPDIQQIYHNTSAMIAHLIKTNFTGRPDLALTYYPSQMEFNWFVSRIVAVMEISESLPAPVMETAFYLMRNATQGAMTTSILSQTRQEKDDQVYFDDFLGDGDRFLNKTWVRGEDRIFTTAMAANALMYIWTQHDDSTKNFHWKEGTPKRVITTVRGCIKWLTKNTLSGKYKPWNAFFSGSSKSVDTLPFWYPANRFEHLNGSAIHDWSNLPTDAFILAVQSYISPNTYNTMLKDTHFGRPTPLDFEGYNSDPGFFPFWSSVPYTYSATMLAVARFGNIVR